VSADLTWGLTFIALGVIYTAIVAIYLRAERRRRLDAPTWWERDIRHRQIEHERADSEPHIWNH
jgi:hypothetical protein